MTDKDRSMEGAIRVQGYALLLMGDFPPNLKKKLLYQLLNELGIKLEKRELGELERFYKKSKMGKKMVYASSTNNPGTLRSIKPPRYCAFCGKKGDYSPDRGLLCSGCSKPPIDCTCEDVGAVAGVK